MFTVCGWERLNYGLCVLQICSNYCIDHLCGLLSYVWDIDRY